MKSNLSLQLEIFLLCSLTKRYAIIHGHDLDEIITIVENQGDALTNTTLRNRFGLKESSAGSVSRLIKEAVSQKKIKPLDPNTAHIYMRYIPIWG